MSAYLGSLIGVSIAVSVALALSYRGGTAEKTAYAIILLYAAVMPVGDLIKNVDLGGLSFDAPSFSQLQSGVSETAEEAFEKGIRAYLADEFSLNMDEVDVLAEDFSADQMRARRVTVTLTGKSVSADYRAIREKVEKNGFGECEVRIEI